MKSIAENKKKENIVEYILYMYRMEDLLRAYDFNLEDIKQYVLSHEKIPEKERAESDQWYKELAKRMKSQGIEKEGHLSETQKLVDELAALHWRLIKKDPDYFNLNVKTKPYLLDLIQAAGEKNPGHEVQIFINCLHGLLLSRLNGRKVASPFLEAAAVFGEALAYLNIAYQKKSLI
ncbi:MAG: DUF4924 family protein [Cyclobacteriaceae bacterium]